MELVKKETFTVLLGTAVGIAITTILSFFIVWIGFPVDTPRESFKDALGFSGGLFGGLTTFGAAIVAAHLFNDWRDEKNYDLEASLLYGVLADLKPIFIELHKIRSNSENLKEIDSHLIIKTDYLDHTKINLYEAVIGLYANINAYSKIKKDPTLIDFYNRFDKHLFILNDFYIDLFHKKYKSYYTNAIAALTQHDNSKQLSYYDIFRPYSGTLSEIQIDIMEIQNVFKPNALRASIGGQTRTVTYGCVLEETINLHNKIENYCIDRLAVSS